MASIVAMPEPEGAVRSVGSIRHGLHANRHRQPMDCLHSQQCQEVLRGEAPTCPAAPRRVPRGPYLDRGVNEYNEMEVN